MPEEFQNLRNFLGGYFHQDWDLESPDAAGVFAVYRRLAAPETLDAICAEIKSLLVEPNSARVTADFLLDELWCYYNPENDGQTDIEFLRRVLKEFSIEKTG